ncbi:hypothetical protein [Pseudoalteromonas sp. S558]|uniref:hypothetical protein n=1 Tax=Pseudoalteromonas sp. S558 TaxID=2066515 RepID=UPI001BB0FAFA|nr:hypothetical protein [Pseudoalteromonas sp. S558]
MEQQHQQALINLVYYKTTVTPIPIAVRSTGYQEGLDTLVKMEGTLKLRFIDFIGGTACYSQRSCKGYSDEKDNLKKQYFSREGFPSQTAVKTYQVHLPENTSIVKGL